MWHSVKKRIKDYLQIREGHYSLYFKNLRGEEMLEIEERVIFPAASIIKIPIIVELYRQIDRDRIRANELIKISRKNCVGGAGVLHELRSDLEMSYLDLAYLMITVSDNNATNVLIEKLGRENINNLLEELNFKTVLQRKMMDFAARKSGRDNITTALEMGELIQKIYNNNIPDLSISSGWAILEIMKKQIIRDKASFFLPESKWENVASKTGTLNKVEHDVSLFDFEDFSYILVILSRDLPTNAYGSLTAARTARFLYKYFKNPKNCLEEEFQNDY